MSQSSATRPDGGPTILVLPISVRSKTNQKIVSNLNCQMQNTEIGYVQMAIMKVQQQELSVLWIVMEETSFTTPSVSQEYIFPIKLNLTSECSPDGDWFKRYGSGKCICEPGCDSKRDCCKDDSGNKKDPNYNPLCMPCPHKCKQDACDKKDLPPIHGNGSWRCAWIKNDKGEKEYACVVMVRSSNIGYIK